MSEEINKMLDEFVDDIKQALDYCFDVIYDDAWNYMSDEDKGNIRKAKEIYDKHFGN